MENKGERICLYLAAVLECGPFGGEIPEVDGNRITFSSQAGRLEVMVNDNGSVDIDWDGEEDDEEDEVPNHFDSIAAAVGAGISWLYDLEEADLQVINRILAD